jgi:hypothetical protein
MSTLPTGHAALVVALKIVAGSAMSRSSTGTPPTGDAAGQANIPRISTPVGCNAPVGTVPKIPVNENM